jgi:hypothetical protein
MDGDATNAAVGVGTGEKRGDGTATAGGITVGVGNTKAGVLCDPDGGALPHPAIPPAKTLYSLRAKRLRPTQAIDRSTIQPLRNDDASFLSDRFLNHIHARDHMVLQPRVQTGCVAFIDAHCFPSWKAISDAQSAAILRIRRPIYPPNARVRATCMLMHVPSRFYVSKDERTELIGRKFAGSSRH